MSTGTGLLESKHQEGRCRKSTEGLDVTSRPSVVLSVVVWLDQPLAFFTPKATRVARTASRISFFTMHAL
jgi:hypothetical protein